MNRKKGIEDSLFLYLYYQRQYFINNLLSTIKSINQTDIDCFTAKQI